MSTKDPSIGWQQRLPSVKLQAAFFKMKFPDVDEVKVNEITEDFKAVDTRGRGELQEDEALRLLERRQETRTYVQLRKMVKDIEPDRTRLFSLLEFLCAYFVKSWKILHAPVANQEDIDEAIKKIQEAEELEREAEENKRLAEEKEREAEEEKKRKEEFTKQKEQERLDVIENERLRKKSLELKEQEEKKRKELEISASGVKGMAAKFKYAGEDTKDATMTNEEKIKAEAAARKAAKQKELERKEAEKQEQVAAELKKRAEEERIRAEEEKEKAEKERLRLEEEKKELEKGTEESTIRQQERLKQQEEEEKRIAEEAEAARKARVQAALKAKFGKKE